MLFNFDKVLQFLMALHHGYSLIHSALDCDNGIFGGGYELKMRPQLFREILINSDVTNNDAEFQKIYRNCKCEWKIDLRYGQMTKQAEQ